MIAAQSPFWRHIAACNAMPDEARLLAFHMAGQRVGWLLPEAARVLTFFPQHVHFDQQGVALAARLRSAPARSAALAELGAALVRAGLAARLRGELYDVRAAPGGPVLSMMDELGAATGEAIILAIPSGITVRYVHVVPATKPMRLHVGPGDVRPMALSGIGRFHGPRYLWLQPHSDEFTVHARQALQPLQHAPHRPPRGRQRRWQPPLRRP